MVQTDLSQLTTECNDWLQILRNYREEFQTSKKIASGTLSKRVI